MPECNSHVERFHGLCLQFLWQRHQFTSLAEVESTYPAFLHAFRSSHRLSRLEGQTPAEYRQQRYISPIPCLDASFQWEEGHTLPIVSGYVHCLRLTDHQAQLQVLGRPYTLPKAFSRCFIRATLDVAAQEVTFFYQEDANHQPEPINRQPFPLDAPVIPWEPTLYQQYLPRK